MDPFSTVLALCTLAISLKKWLDDIKDKDSTIAAISANVDRICVLLEPFKDATGLDPAVQKSLLAVGEALARTKEHLSVWEKKHTKKRTNSLKFGSLTELLDPSRTTRKLQEDERQLSQQIMLMSFSMTASSYLRDRSAVISEDAEDDFISSSIRNQEVLKFWRGYIDAKVSLPPSCQSVFHLAHCHV
jgi:hypothetical protein